MDTPFVKVCLGGTFLILAVGAVYFAKPILLPLALAFMLTLTLSPVVRFLARHRVPEVVSALAIVLALLGASGAGLYLLSEPVSGWIDGAPNVGRQIEDKVRSLRGPVDAAVSASKQVEKIARGDDPTVQKVTVQQPGFLALAAGNAMAFATTAAITVVLLFFLLASGRLFYEKIVRVLPTLTEKKRAVRVLHEVEEEISRYLLTITLINAGLGVAIAVAMGLLGMPNPGLWGVMAALLNFVPYLGAVVGIVVVTIVALVSFDLPGTAAIVGGAYFACTAIEGQLITPALLGRRLEMNTVAVFLAVAAWGWLWGIPGALMAVPFLVSLRVLCEHFEELSGLGEFLSGPVAESADETAAPAAPAATVVRADAGTAEVPDRR